MVGIFIFPVKPDNKDYQFYKEPRKVLELKDEEIFSLANTSKGIYYRIRHDNEWDKMTDNEVVDKWNTDVPRQQIQLTGRKSGQGYTTVDKCYFIRIVRK